MGFEGFEIPEKKYQAEVEHLNKIAVHVFGSDRGDFLRTLADAWIQADNSDKRILKPMLEAIVVKYSLAEEVYG